MLYIICVCIGSYFPDEPTTLELPPQPTTAAKPPSWPSDSRTPVV